MVGIVHPIAKGVEGEGLPDKSDFSSGAFLRIGARCSTRTYISRCPPPSFHSWKVNLQLESPFGPRDRLDKKPHLALYYHQRQQFADFPLAVAQRGVRRIGTFRPGLIPRSIVPQVDPSLEFFPKRSNAQPSTRKIVYTDHTNGVKADELPPSTYQYGWVG